MKKFLSLLLLSTVIFCSCHLVLGKKVRGNGNITTIEHAVHAVKDVQVSGNFDLIVKQGEIAPVRVQADENLMSYIEVREEGDKLIIKTKEGYNLRPTNHVRIYVTAPVFRDIDLSGAGTISNDAHFSNNESLKLQISGAGDIDMNVDAPAVRAEISGAGDVKLKGETKNLDLDITGASSAHCYEMKSENTKVEIAGTGDANVYASVKLEAEISGAGTITYKGGAGNVVQRVSGAGSVKKAD